MPWSWASYHSIAWAKLVMVAWVWVGQVGRGARALEELAPVASCRTSNVTIRLMAFGLSGPFGYITSWPMVSIPWDAISSVSKVGWGVPPEPCQIIWQVLKLIHPPTLIFRPFWIPYRSSALSLVTSDVCMVGISLPQIKWCQTFMFC